MRITKKFSGGQDPRKWAEGIISKIESRNRESMTNAIENGSQIMKEHISNRGIHKRGRIDTARMVGAVGSTVRERTRDKWSGAFGWVDDKADYFVYQEEGFTHAWSGNEIPAMYAKQDAAAEVWDTLKYELGENAKNA